MAGKNVKAVCSIFSCAWTDEAVLHRRRLEVAVARSLTNPSAGTRTNQRGLTLLLLDVGHKHAAAHVLQGMHFTMHLRLARCISLASCVSLPGRKHCLTDTDIAADKETWRASECSAVSATLEPSNGQQVCWAERPAGCFDQPSNLLPPDEHKDRGAECKKAVCCQQALPSGVHTKLPHLLFKPLYR